MIYELMNFFSIMDPIVHSILHCIIFKLTLHLNIFRVFKHGSKGSRFLDCLIFHDVSLSDSEAPSCHWTVLQDYALCTLTGSGVMAFFT